MTASALDVVVLLGRAQEAVTRAMEAQLAAFHGLALADFLLLDRLVHGPLSTAELSAGLGRTASVVARSLTPLERGGELTRADGIVALTDAGRQLVDDARRTAEHVAKQVLFQPPGGGRLFTDADRETLAGFLTRLVGRPLP